VINKGFIGAIAGGIGVVIAFLVITSSGLLQPPSQDQQFVMKDVVLNLKSVSVVSADEEETVIEVAFDAFNPNRSSVVLESIQYSLYANGIRIANSEIGERAEGFVTGAGKTFTMYREFSMTLKDKVEVKKIEPITQVWDDLQNDNVQWRVSGTFVVTDPVRAGGNEVDFDFAI
jgi:hypothetical protein